MDFQDSLIRLPSWALRSQAAGRGYSYPGVLSSTPVQASTLSSSMIYVGGSSPGRTTSDLQVLSSNPDMGTVDHLAWFPSVALPFRQFEAQQGMNYLLSILRDDPLL
jgi:hypothetical protein